MTEATPLPDAPTGPGISSGSIDTVPLSKLSDTQVFARDPEDYSTETTADTIARLTKIVARQRKARQDDQEVAALAAKMKKANAASRKKKVKDAAPSSINIMDTPIT